MRAIRFRTILYVHSKTVLELKFGNEGFVFTFAHAKDTGSLSTRGGPIYRRYRYRIGTLYIGFSIYQYRIIDN